MGSADKYTPVDNFSVRLLCALCKETVIVNETHYCKNVKPVNINNNLLFDATGDIVGGIEIQHVEESK